MEPLRFVHAADLHIDSPITGLKSRNETVGKRVQQAGYEALQKLVDLCTDEKVDFLLVAGDVYDGAIRSPQAQIRFRDALNQLSEAGIESFVVHGNHDPLDGRFSSITWPEGVHVFGDSPAWEIARRDGTPIAQVQGVSYPTREVTDNLAARFASVNHSDLFSIGLLHCNLGGDPAHPNYAPCSMDDLRVPGIDYWALGHIHKKSVRREQFTTVVYPGNIQARDAGEPGERGCYLVEVGPDRRPHPDFRPLDVVRWDLREVPIGGIEGVDELRNRVLESLDESLHSADGRDVVCRVTLTGRGPMHAELSGPQQTDWLLELVHEEFATASPWIWVERIANETRTEIDLEVRAEQDNFLGEVLRRARRTQPAEFGEALSEVFSGRRGPLQPLEEQEIQGLIEEARWYLAELFEPPERTRQDN